MPASTSIQPGTGVLCARREAFTEDVENCAQGFEGGRGGRAWSTFIGEERGLGTVDRLVLTAATPGEAGG